MDNYLKAGEPAQQFTRVLFFLYLGVLCWILLFKLGVRFSYMEARSVNLIPFREQLSAGGAVDLPEMVLNVVVFVPMGMYAGVLFKAWKLGQQVLFIFLMSLVVEGVQFILAVGAFDGTDIVNNTLGGVIGLLLCRAIIKGFNSPLKAQKFINGVMATGTVLMIVLLVLLKLKMLPIRYQ